MCQEMVVNKGFCVALEQLDLFKAERIKKKNWEKEKLLGSLFLWDHWGTDSNNPQSQRNPQLLHVWVGVGVGG